jgi:Helix-turn-helix domain/Tc5 transposase DNA-binding domain
MKDTKRTLKIKLSIIEEAQRCGNIRATARKYNIQPQQIRYWKRTRNLIFEAIKRNPQAKTINEGRPIKKSDVEVALLEWMKELRTQDIAINTRQVIIKSLSIDPEFHNGNVRALWNWIYVFLARNNLSIRKMM